MSSSWPSRSISSYCTDGGCSPSAVAAASASLNAFSITSYYVSLDGLFTPCSSSYGACNWTAGTGSVERSNADLQQSSGLLAQPPHVPVAEVVYKEGDDGRWHANRRPNDQQAWR